MGSVWFRAKAKELAAGDPRLKSWAKPLEANVREDSRLSATRQAMQVQGCMTTSVQAPLARLQEELPVAIEAS